MKEIVNRLFELINEEELNYEDLAKKLGLSDVSIIYTWKREEYLPSTEMFIKLSELFNCSLDYLFARTDDFGVCGNKKISNFYSRLEEIIKKHKIKKCILQEEKICSSNNLFKWRNGAVPKVETLIKLADYFGVTIDYLLGRE